jgi:hypothetical protein
VEKARQVRGQHSRHVGVGVLDERLGNEDAGVVDQGVDATEAEAEAGRRAVIDADPPRSRGIVSRSPSGFLAEIAAG